MACGESMARASPLSAGGGRCQRLLLAPSYRPSLPGLYVEGRESSEAVACAVGQATPPPWCAMVSSAASNAARAGLGAGQEDRWPLLLDPAGVGYANLWIFPRRPPGRARARARRFRWGVAALRPRLRGRPPAAGSAAREGLRPAPAAAGAEAPARESGSPPDPKAAVQADARRHLSPGPQHRGARGVEAA